MRGCKCDAVTESAGLETNLALDYSVENTLKVMDGRLIR